MEQLKGRRLIALDRPGFGLSDPVLGAKLGAIRGGLVDGCGRRWNRKPLVWGCVDSCGHLWTALVDLRIRRLGVELGEFAKSLRVYGNFGCAKVA